MFKRPKAKCKIIPIEEFDGIPRIVAEDDKHRYFINVRGHITKLRRKNCFSCSEPARFVIIFTYAKHRRVERFCRNHASNYGELPDIQQQQQEYYDELSNEQKIAFQTMQKWNNIKVNI